jgi:PIN domain nuclease of toxin-antitoxin system
MNYLLDTHTLLWILSDDSRLSPKAKNNFLDENNGIYLSMASIWEMSIKSSLHKLEIKSTLEKFVEQHVLNNDIRILNIELVHLYPLEKLPFYHRDPFDRLIISQAIYEKMPVISSDINFDLYSVKRIW